MPINAITKQYDAPPVNEKEIFRYAMCGKEPSEDMKKLYEDSVKEALPACSYKVCYIRMPIKWEEDAIDLGFGKIHSKGLISNLSGCREVIIFASTVGIQMDRLIAKYGRVSPAKSLMMQAIGAERIESLCDLFNEEMNAELCREGFDTRVRYSPGYKDFSLDFQRGIFDILGCSTKIGLSLNDSMLMSPSKSVTAIIGISEEFREKGTKNKCLLCNKTDCQFRTGGKDDGKRIH